MPGTPQPVGRGPSNLPPFWNAVMQAITQQQQATNALAAGAQQTILVDQWGNAQVILGQLNQTVTIGASYQQAGVIVTTALPTTGHPIVGVAWQQNLITTTVTLTKGSTAATVGTNTIANGMVIGAATVVVAGVKTATITPGTTVTAGGGTTSLTLSEPAAESGSGLYCAACNFRSLEQISFP